MLLTTSDDVLDCLSLSIKDRLFSTSQICTGNGRPVLKNVTCDCSNCLSGSLSPSPSSCTASCFLWFEEDGGSSTFLLIKNLAGDMAYQILMQLTKKSCRQEYNLPQDVTSNCCTSGEYLHHLNMCVCVCVCDDAIIFVCPCGGGSLVICLYRLRTY